MTDARRVVVIGAGAAGLLAAGRAAECGADVLALERNRLAGRKLRICGKGRANVTNTAEVREFIQAFGDNGKFLYGPFSRFFNTQLVDLLQRIGVPTKAERGGRVFPVSDDANDVADALRRWAEGAGARFQFGARVKGLILQDSCVRGVQTARGAIEAGAVVLATGGITYPATGSTGDGYRMAAEAGHTVTPPRPALTAMTCAEGWVKQVQGVSLRNVEATLLAPGPSGQPKAVAKQFGEMLFTHFGVSGPIILTLSRKALDLLPGGGLTLSLCLKPALSEEQILARLEREMTGMRHYRNYLAELLPHSLAPVFGELSGIAPDMPVRRIPPADRRRVAELLRALPLKVTGLRPPEEAIVTAGGVVIREIDPRTMQSRVAPGLYLAGEVIDLDATTGGYNLQAAFTTGWIAGESAASA